MTMPASPSVLTALLCLGLSSVFSMRKRAATSWLDDLPSRAQMAGRRSSKWSGAVCYWNNATEQCLALALARPQNAPNSMCEPTTLQYPLGPSKHPQTLTMSQCKARIGNQGLACEWNTTHSQDCKEPDCYDLRNQVGCERSPLDCRWVNDTSFPFCTQKNCWNHDTEDACSVANCDWRHGACTEASCWDFRDRMDCANGSSRLTGRRRNSYRYGNDLGDRCFWDDSFWDQCEGSTGCNSYDDQSACNADLAKWGTCEWNARISQCLHMASCEDYDTKSACTADAVGVGEKTFPGAACWWKLGPNLTVGPAHRIDSWNQVETSQMLMIHSDHTLKGFNGSDIWQLIYHFGLEAGWKTRPTPVEKVLDASSKVMSWSDIPTPIPDGFQLFFASCEDNLPPRGEEDFLTACNHHSRATCDTATSLFPLTPAPTPAPTTPAPACPSYCGRASCWMSMCAEYCASCM